MHRAISERVEGTLQRTMIDTHSHMLPGLDHGCPDLATSLLMAQEAWRAGTTTVVCTPHLYDWDPTLLDEAHGARAQVEAALREREIGLQLLLGFEVDASVLIEADDDMVARLAIAGGAEVSSAALAPGEPAGGATGRQESGWKGAILIETPFQGWPPFLAQTVFMLKSKGYTPILAHPERNERLQRSLELLDDCVGAGAVLQGTAGSLSEMFRRGSMRTLLDLLARGALSLLASDAHAHVPYTWTLAPVLDELRRRVPEDYLDALVSTNPKRVLAGEPPLPASPTTGRQAGRSWWRS